MQKMLSMDKLSFQRWWDNMSNYIGKTIEELHELLVSKKVTPLELAKEVIEEIKRENTNAIETLAEKEALEFASSLNEVEEDNVFWGTKRFLCMFSKRDVGREFPLPENNLFYAETFSEEICLFRYTNSNGTRHFLHQLPLGAEKNTLIVYKGAEQESLVTAKNILLEAIERIANGVKQG